MQSHGDLEALLTIEEMVEVIGVVAHIDLQPVHLTIETIAAVISGDAATGFEANIEGFVSRKNEWFGLFYPTLTHLVAIQIEAQATALGDAIAIVGKLDPHLMTARRDRLPLHNGGGEAKEVVGVAKLARLGIERPATNAAANSNDHAIGTLGRHLQFGRDRMGGIFVVDDRSFAEAPHAAK